jgi:hypothetical protein
MGLNTPQFRISFPALFQPKLNELNGNMEYSCVALFPKDADLSELKQAAEAAVVDKWGSDSSKWPKPLKSPFRDQGEKEYSGYESGAVFMTLKSKNKPGIVDANVKSIIDPSKVYAGVWALAHVNAFAYDQKGNRGVSFGLEHIQIVKDDEPLDGRTKVDAAFKPIATAKTGQAAGAPATNLFG